MENRTLFDSLCLKNRQSGQNARKRIRKIVIGVSLIGAGFVLYALSFGPCGAGYFALIPGAALLLYGIGKIVMSFRIVA